MGPFQSWRGLFFDVKPEVKMYYSIGFEKNVENIAVLASSADPRVKMKSFEDLKRGYVNYVEKSQAKAVLPNRPISGAFRAKSLDEKAQLVEAFRTDASLNDMEQENLIENLNHPLEAEMTARFEEALEYLQVTAPRIRELFDLVFNYYFFAYSKKAVGGSTSGGLGILWLNPRPEWQLQDFVEIIVHELTHQLLFIDERRFRHYSDYPAMSLKENFAYSTILNKSRPMDKVIHSYFVGFNVLKFRQQYFGENSVPMVHPSSGKIAESLERTLASLTSAQEQLMTERLRNLISQRRAHA
jgi:hypothetical protein